MNPKDEGGVEPHMIRIMIAAAAEGGQGEKCRKGGGSGLGGGSGRGTPVALRLFEDGDGFEAGAAH